MKSAIVLGAGMAGVSTALTLLDRGWDVTLVDRKRPGQETSFGNAGIIQAEALEPYAMPRSVAELLSIATGRTNDVFYSFRELPYHVTSLLRYWWHSAPVRHREAAEAWATLILRATSTHSPLIERAGADNLVRRGGFTMLMRNQLSYDQVFREAIRKRSIYGTNYRALSGAEMQQAEPALKHGGVGAIQWLDAWTVSDPGGLVSAYADLFERGGGRFVQGNAETLRRNGEGWAVESESGPVEAENVVVTLGPWSTGMLQSFGHRFQMVHKRGYHAHYSAPQSLNAPVMDTDNGYLLLPMLAGTRITTGAHIARIGSKPAYDQLTRAEKAASDLFELGPRVEDVPWQGTRPCMPDMLPVIGPSQREKGLWLNFGHGHQGFTLGPATAEALGAAMDGETPPVDLKPFRPDRY
jgi:D-amino-acid dehydrogenase